MKVYFLRLNLQRTLDKRSVGRRMADGFPGGYLIPSFVVVVVVVVIIIIIIILLFWPTSTNRAFVNAEAKQM